MTPGTEPSFSGGSRESGLGRLGRFVRENLADTAAEVAPGKLMYKSIKEFVPKPKKKPRMADKPPKISLRKAYEE